MHAHRRKACWPLTHLQASQLPQAMLKTPQNTHFKMFHCVPYLYREILRWRELLWKPLADVQTGFCMASEIMWCLCVIHVHVTFQCNYWENNHIILDCKFLMNKDSISTKIRFVDYVRKADFMWKGQCEMDLDVIHIRTNKRAWAKQRRKSCCSLWPCECLVTSVKDCVLVVDRYCFLMADTNILESRVADIKL